ncbi:MAG: S9 family peptidase [Gammaproteobacteria bacterium]|nr:S9 family peptidase [Pseudomonadales bacterium]
MSLVLLLTTACSRESDPAQSTGSGPDTSSALTGTTRYTIEQFMDSTAYSGASFSPDNSKILVSNTSTGIFNVYALPLDGGAPEQLTHSDSDANLAISYFPDDERFLFTADQGGNELNHLYVMELDGTVTDLTPGNNLKASFAGWSEDYASFYVQTNERDPRFFDVYRYQLELDYPRQLVFENSEGLTPGQVSGDGRYLTLVQLKTANDNDLYVQDLRSGERLHVTPHEGNVSSRPSDFSPDSRYLYYLTDEGSEFSRLMRIDLASQGREEILAANWDVMYGSFSRDGNYLVVATNEDARTRLTMLDARTLEELPAPEVPGADVTSLTFSHGDSLVAMYAGGDRFPRDLFVSGIGDPRPPQRLTRSLSPEIDQEDLVEAELVRFPSYDGLEIPGVLWTPHEASTDHKTPALVWVHGGPGGQTRAGFSPLIQYLVNHGYVVYGINNRGSSGYGKTFHALDDRQHGEADLGDVVASKEMLIETGVVDPQRIGIIGGSYGGYMVLAALAFAPQEFAVGVDMFGISNWLRTLENTPPWWGAQRDALFDEMGDPATDRERLERISPLFHAANIVKPLIVLQGANDPRVLQVESDEIVAAVRRNDVHVDYHVYPDEGHGFRNRTNQINGYRAIREFLDRYLMEAQ